MLSSMLVLAAVLGMMNGLPLDFLFPDDVQDAEGVALAAQRPATSTVLLPTDPERPLLWYMPAAALPGNGVVRVWYQRVEKSLEDYADQRVLCLGYYRDGRLDLPDLHPEPPAWGGPNNVVLRRSPHKPSWGGFNVFQIVPEGETLRLLYWDAPADGTAGAMLAESTDGLAWRKDPRGAVFTETNDAFTLMAGGDGYLLYQTKLEPWPDKPYVDNLGNWRRVQSIRRSPDLVSWTTQEVVLHPDEHDQPETEFYLMKTFPCGNAYAGLLMKYYADPARPGEHSGILANELITSRDAVTWQRPFRETDLGFWTYADPFPDAGRLTFAAYHYGDNRFRAVSYAPGRLSGVVAEGTGSFLTAPLPLPEKGFLLDADASRGWIEVDLLDPHKRPLPSPPLRVSGTDAEEIPLRWDNLEPFSCGIARLRFRLHQATVYALRKAHPAR